MLKQFSRIMLCGLLVVLLAGLATPALAQADCSADIEYGDVGDSAMAEADYAAAVEAYTCVIQLAPNDYQGYIRRSEAALLAGDYMMALADRNSAISLAIDDWATLSIELSDIYAAQIDDDPTAIAPRILYAFLKLFDGDTSGAAEQYDAILKLDFNNAFAWLFRGLTEQEQGISDNFESDLQRAIELDPDNPAVYTLIALIYLGDGDVDSAVDYFEQAIAADDSYAYAYYERGFYAASQGDYEQAIEDYTRAINNDYTPASTPLFERANLYITTQDYDSALDDFNTLIELDPENISYYENRASIYLSLNDLESAIAEYDRIAEIAPDNANNYLTRGTYKLLREDMEGGAADFLLYVQLIETDQVDMGALEPGDTATINMDFGRNHYFTFDAQEGDVFTITAISPDTLVDPLIIILDEDGTPIYTNDDIDPSIPDFNAMIEGWEAPADGTYTLIVSHAAAGSFGPVDVTLEAGTGSGSDA